jgi:cell division septation protein DedD
VNPLDVLAWCAVVVALVVTAGLCALAASIAGREIGIALSSLAAHRARHAQTVAEARAAQERAELEAADSLAQRIALPFGGTVSRADELNQRLDRLETELIQAHAAAERARQATIVTHTDVPLSPRQAAADAYNRERLR